MGSVGQNKKAFSCAFIIIIILLHKYIRNYAILPAFTDDV